MIPLFAGFTSYAFNYLLIFRFLVFICELRTRTDTSVYRHILHILCYSPHSWSLLTSAPKSQKSFTISAFKPWNVFNNCHTHCPMPTPCTHSRSYVEYYYFILGTKWIKQKRKKGEWTAYDKRYKNTKLLCPIFIFSTRHLNLLVKLYLVLLHYSAVQRDHSQQVRL